MPIYDYICSACNHRLEVIHGVSEAGPRYCPVCGADGTMKKAIVPPAIHFKGSGWAKKDRSATAVPGRSKAAAKPSEPASTPSPAGSSEGSTGPSPSPSPESSSGTGGGSSDGD